MSNTHQPELPAPQGFLLLHNQGGVSQVRGYTAKQMQAYGDAREAAALSRPQDGWVLVHRQTLEIVDTELSNARAKVKASERAWLIDLRRLTKGMLSATPTAGQGGESHRDWSLRMAAKEEGCDVTAGDMSSMAGSPEWRARVLGAEPTPDPAAPAITVKMRCVTCLKEYQPPAVRCECGSVVGAYPVVDTAAPVSERARELLASQFDADDVTAAAARRIRASNETPVESAALRALEQALTQQRGGTGRLCQRNRHGQVHSVTRHVPCVASP